ncbi:hypothetical protein [Streptomyces sp. NRRL F-5193]|uniref:hypothetical protein n=1 Tax=Streptomyces sp. NRRL F-5193 TaxID=1463860 RepID=UPI0005BD7AE1|nr:hypothetical protein [Streptomyces sp. NRRL F-5193]
MSPEPLPPVAPEVLAEAVGQLTARLRKKLDAAVAECAGKALAGSGGSVEVRFGEDTLVILRPGPSGAVTEPGQAVCSCLLAPRCLHRAAVLGAAPLADADTVPPADPAAPEPSEGTPPPVTAPVTASSVPVTTEEARPSPTPAQVDAAAGLWLAAAEALAAGVTAGGTVVQAELLRAAHSARLAGLPRAEAAALRVVRGLRTARERHRGQRLSDLTAAFRTLLAGAAALASGAAGAEEVGTARRAYTEGGSLRVLGLCREPVLSATGYGGVTTHLLGPDGSLYTLSDVRPGGVSRAKGAGTASVALGGAVLDHAGLARGGLLIAGATVSADGRLGAGRGVRATPVRGADWSQEPVAAFFARPVREAVASSLDAAASAPGDAGPALLGCDVEVLGAADDHLLARVLDGGPLVRLRVAHPHPELAHAENLRRIGGFPGVVLRVLGRPDPDRAATLRPLAVGPVPGASSSLRLPEEWRGHADLGYDRLQGDHFPRPEAGAAPGTPGPAGTDPLADAPLWRVRRLLETGVAGGRRAVAEAARGADRTALGVPLRRAGLAGAAELAEGLATEADRRPRDSFGRLVDASPDAYARAWLASAVHLDAAERALVTASWS